MSVLRFAGRILGYTLIVLAVLVFVGCSYYLDHLRFTL